MASQHQRNENLSADVSQDKPPRADLIRQFNLNTTDPQPPPLSLIQIIRNSPLLSHDLLSIFSSVISAHQFLFGSIYKPFYPQPDQILPLPRIDFLSKRCIT